MDRRDFLKGFLATGCVLASGAEAGAAAAQGGTRRDGAVRFLVFNDIHERPKLPLEIARHVKRDMDFTVMNGDLIEDIRDEESVRKFILAPMKDIADLYGVPCHFVRGNHEWRGVDKEKLGGYMAFEAADFYRAFTLRGVRFVFLDTFEDAKGKYEPFIERVAKENEWLRREVASDAWRNAVKRIVVMHIPPPVEPQVGKRIRWTCTSPGLREMDDILNASGVSFLCGAHLHRRRIQDVCDFRSYPMFVGGGPEHKSDVGTEVTVSADGIGVRQIDKKGVVVESAYFA